MRAGQHVLSAIAGSSGVAYPDFGWPISQRMSERGGRESCKPAGASLPPRTSLTTVALQAIVISAYTTRSPFVHFVFEGADDASCSAHAYRARSAAIAAHYLTAARPRCRSLAHATSLRRGLRRSAVGQVTAASVSEDGNGTPADGDDGEYEDAILVGRGRGRGRSRLGWGSVHVELSGHAHVGRRYTARWRRGEGDGRWENGTEQDDEMRAVPGGARVRHF
ncbi:hypothetical protein B0H10DRAFT_2201681, partial [Mycena sp. CBHHK59/15]